MIRPMLPDDVASARSRLTDRQVRRMRRVIAAHGNQGGMLQAVAFADPDGPARLGMEREAVVLAR